MDLSLLDGLFAFRKTPTPCFQVLEDTAFKGCTHIGSFVVNFAMRSFIKALARLSQVVLAVMLFELDTAVYDTIQLLLVVDSDINEQHTRTAKPTIGTQLFGRFSMDLFLHLEGTILSRQAREADWPAHRTLPRPHQSNGGQKLNLHSGIVGTMPCCIQRER